MRVMVYNIHAGKDAGGVDNLVRVAALVAETGADVVLLQEVDRGTQRSAGVDHVAELRRLTGFHGAFGRTLDYQGGQYGIAVLSRWPIVSDTMIQLPVVPPQERAGGSYEPRGALHVRIMLPGSGDTLDVVNTHLDPSGNPHYRRQEIAGVLRAIADVGGTLTFLGGDLNATPDDSAIASINGSGLRDSWTSCNAAGPGLSYPASTPVKRIDYLWLPPRARCDNARVLDTQASDHRPLLVTLTIGR
jgi:endonuclease/exonuclease/phosphatase family metal-dependent hydrolase